MKPLLMILALGIFTGSAALAEEEKCRLGYSKHSEGYGVRWCAEEDLAIEEERTLQSSQEEKPAAEESEGYEQNDGRLSHLNAPVGWENLNDIFN